MNTIEEGIYFDMSEADYRAAPGVNVSALKSMRLSPAHYKYAREEQEDKQNAALIVGTLVHRAKLEPDRLCYAVRPAMFDSWRTKASQEWRDAQTLPAVTPEEEQDVLRCADALGRLDLLTEAAARGNAEVKCFKRHKRTGLMLKGAADLVFTDDNGVTWIIDLKTVPEEGACKDAFSRKIADLNYHMQAAFYADLFETNNFIFVAVEKKGFPGVAAYQLDQESMEVGRRTNEALLAQLSRCFRDDRWDGYDSGVQTIKLPGWKIKQDGSDIQ
jgi:hypothetical protein